MPRAESEIGSLYEAIVARIMRIGTTPIAVATSPSIKGRVASEGRREVASSLASRETRQTTSPFGRLPPGSEGLPPRTEDAVTTVVSLRASMGLGQARPVLPGIFAKALLRSLTRNA